MKNKKGFTLIELLAVIVILAIIMVIAVPQILNVIEGSEKQAYKESVELMARTAKLQYESKEITNSAGTLPITYTYSNNEQTSPTEKLDFKGDKPKSGTITLDVDKDVIIENLVSKNGKWCANKTKTGSVEVNSCDGSGGASSSWDMYYSKNNRSGTTEFNQDWKYYIRQNTTTGDAQLCGVFSGGTVCLVNSPTGYDLRGEYASNKRAEFESVGAECETDYYYGTTLCHQGYSINCRIEKSGNVTCDTSWGGTSGCMIRANGEFGF